MSRLPHWFPKATSDQQRRWHLWKTAERTAIRELNAVALEVMMKDEPAEERKAG